MTRKQCPDCHSQMPAKARNCGYCNYKFIQQSTTTKYHKNDLDDKSITEILLEKSGHQKLEEINKKLDQLVELIQSIRESKNTSTEIYLKRINEKISNLQATSKKKTWVKVGVIRALTGWDNRKLYQARQNNLIEFKVDLEGKLVYCLESIHPFFLNKS